jgi:hypothetical protein
MYGAAQGQSITQAAARSNARERSGARTLEGLFRSSSGLPGAPGGTKRTPIETPRRRRAPVARLTTAKRVGGVRVRARIRRSSADPRRVKPMGASSGRRTNHASGRQGLSEGSKPGNRGSLGRPIASAAGLPTRETVRGCFPPETARIPSGRRKLRRVNPMSAAGVKQNRHGIRGRKPSRG